MPTLPPAEVADAAAAAFVAAAAAACATAWERDPAAERWLRIAGRCVRVRFAGGRMADAIAPAFAHLECAPLQTADLTIALWDSVSTGIALPPVSWRLDDLDRVGRVRPLCGARFTTVHEPETGQFWMLDRQTRTAVAWMNDLDAVPLWDCIHPLRRLLHTWARGFGADLVHAGAVGIDGDGVLVVGPGGTGKSTTVLAAMQAGLSAVGDDYVLVDGGSTPGSLPSAHALYNTMRLHQSHLDRFPGLMAHRDHVFREPWSGRDKVTSYMSRHLPNRLTPGLRLVGIVVPHVVEGAQSAAVCESAAVSESAAGCESAAVSESSARALLALAPSTLLQIDPTDDAMFRRLARLCRILPCWRLPLGSDPTRVGGALIGLIKAGLHPNRAD